jgi:hypothetical protein
MAPCPYIILELGVGGMQSNDSDWYTFRREEDALRIDGVLIYNAFAGINQGARGYGVVRIVLPEYVIPLFEDGEVHVSVDLNSFAGTGTSTLTEPVFYDFSRLTITEAPEPSTVWMFIIGATLFLRKRTLRM